MTDFDSAMAIFLDAQSSGKLAHAYETLLSVDVRGLGVGENAKLHLGLAALEDELGMAEAAQARLQIFLNSSTSAAPELQAKALYYLSASYLRERKLDDAWRAQQALEEMIGADSPIRVRAMWCRAAIQEQQGELKQAQQAYTATRRLAEEHQDLETSLNCLAGVARVQLLSGNFALARITITGILEQVQNDPYQRLYAHCILAFALAGENRRDECLELSARVHQDALRMGLSHIVSRSALLVAMIHVVDKTPELARHWLGLAAAEGGSNQEADELITVLDSAILTGELPEGFDDRTAFEVVMCAYRDTRRCFVYDDRLGRLTSPDGVIHDLKRRGALRRIVQAFTRAKTLSAADLFAAGWPDTTVLSANGIRRVYTEVGRLRKLGFEVGVVEEGYRMRSNIHNL